MYQIQKLKTCKLHGRVRAIVKRINKWSLRTQKMYPFSKCVTQIRQFLDPFRPLSHKNATKTASPFAWRHLQIAPELVLGKVFHSSAKFAYQQTENDINELLNIQHILSSTLVGIAIEKGEGIKWLKLRRNSDWPGNCSGQLRPPQ